jgi:unsaturated chondroitin disaccharide hydrolase
MKKQILPIFFLLILLVSCTQKPEPMQQLIDRSIQVAIQHGKNMAAVLHDQEGKLPRSINPETGELITSDSRWWCSGFYPGTLWYLYEYSNDAELKSLAEVILPG